MIHAASTLDPALHGPAEDPIRVGADPRTVTARWPISRVDPKGWQPHAELRVTYETATGGRGCYTATLTALYSNSVGKSTYAAATPVILVYQRRVGRFRRTQLERVFTRAVSVLRRRFAHDVYVREYFDHTSHIFTNLEYFGIGFHIPGRASNNPAQRWQLHRDVDVTGRSGTGIVAHGIRFPDGTAAMRWIGEPASTVTFDAITHVTSIHGHDGRTRLVWSDPPPQPTNRETTHVAVRTTRDDDDDEVETWALCECPTAALGNARFEAMEIGWQCPNGFLGDVVVVDAVDEFAAGCCTWSQYSDRPDPAFAHGSKLAQARAEHWKCQHTLFGSASEGWNDESDPFFGEAIGTTTEWRFRSLDWGAAVVHTTDERDVAALWVFRDSNYSTLPDTHGYDEHVIVEAAPYPTIDAAKRAGIDMIVGLLSGQHPSAPR
ncbi:hypothetical protein ACIBG0_41785 [Nocardia sp. NPDC050630]|uniref:hypothetical protein n=1 Tax=Nocardia sp. NPDC050630 TaxID=3364321 RepID=UPI00378D1E52